MTDTRNLNTDYPMDKIIYMTSGSYTQAGGGSTISTIAHNLPFRPLLVGNWSTSADFSTTNEMFSPVYADIDGTYLLVFSNDTNAVISGFKATAGNQTIYYRIYGLMPSDVDEDAPATASVADNVVLNTDYNYTKLYYDELVPAAATTTITHNFGYRPQVMAWGVNLSVAHGTGVINQDYDCYITVTDTTVVVHSAAKDVHLKIYADAQL